MFFFAADWSQLASPSSGGLFQMVGNAATVVSNLFSAPVAPLPSSMPPPAAAAAGARRGKFVCNRCVALSNVVCLKSEHGKGGCRYKGKEHEVAFEDWKKARAKDMGVKRKDWSCPAWIKWLRVHRPHTAI